VEFFGATHPVEVEEFLTDYCIVVEDFVELSEFEKEDLFKVVLLNLPILVHGWGEIFPKFLRDQESSRVIVWVVNRLTLEVFNKFFFDEMRACLFDLIEAGETPTDKFIFFIYKQGLFSFRLLSYLTRTLFKFGSHRLLTLLWRGRLRWCFFGRRLLLFFDI